uniref:Uncharacterized protein n=1 Tax=Anguilla anguilla TaxID=7936 RepID=A0A0E9U1Y6_ANGAN
MSVIVETPSGEKVLFTKGAESSIFPHSTGGEMAKTRVHVDEFALVRNVGGGSDIQLACVCLPSVLSACQSALS